MINNDLRGTWGKGGGGRGGLTMMIHRHPGRGASELTCKLFNCPKVFWRKLVLKRQGCRIGIGGTVQ